MLNTFLITGIVLVNAALALYGVALFLELRGRVISRKVVLCFLFAVTADISATAMMIAGSGRIPITLHGVLGYSALAAMIGNLVFLAKVYRKAGGAEVRLSCSGRWFSAGCFIWWVIVYIAGVLLVAARHQ